MDAPVVDEIRQVVSKELPGTVISDLHVRRVAKNRYGCILGLVTDQPLTASAVRKQLAIHEELVHITVEIARGGALAPAYPAD